MEESHTAIMRRAVEQIWNRGDLVMADLLFGAAYVNHGGLIPDLVHGPEAIKISVALFRTAFPDLSIKIERLTAHGDTVELWWVAEGTSRHMPGSGQQGSQPGRLAGTTLSTLVDGKIVESWTEWDHVSALQRLELLPLVTQT